MFREVYKQANDTIKGDRQILDRAFLMAAQPVKKKSPVIKYSFIGTAVAAVMVLGAVFLNPAVFTNRSETIGKPIDENPTEKETIVYSVAATEADLAEDTLEIEIAVEEKAVETTAEKKVTAERVKAPKSNTTQPKASNQNALNEAGAFDGEAVQSDYGIMTLGIDGEDEGAYEGETEAMLTFTLRRPGGAGGEASDEATEPMTEVISEEATEIVTEIATEEVTEEIVRSFSYMYDKSVYEEGEWGVVTEGFVNTDISPITSGTDAIERAKVECTVEYTRTTVFRDSIEDMWMVNFGTDALGGDQSVYMNSDGITELIVYGE